MSLCALLLPILARPVPTALADLGKKYGLEIEIADSAFTKQADRYTISGSAPTDAEVEKYAVVFVKEWSLYPTSLMKKAKVTKIVICADLKVGDQERAAVPAFDLDTMYYDPRLGSSSPHYQRVVVHHEFFHMLDQRMRRLRHDSDWIALNPPEFKYGDGGDKMRTSGVGELTKDIPGFLTPYGTSALEEDKAELFAHLIVDPGFVAERMGSDKFLAAKVALLKKRLEDFDPDMGAPFWEGVAQTGSKPN